MPFVTAWTDDAPENRAVNTLRWHSATRARSAAFVDNRASLRVSEKLGYRPDGTEVVTRRGRPVVDVRLLVGRDTFCRPDWTLEVDGAEACLPMLGLTRG